VAIYWLETEDFSRQATHCQEHQNEYERAKTKDLFSWDDIACHSHAVIKVYPIMYRFYRACALHTLEEIEF
jgi:hypothetical protein